MTGDGEKSGVQRLLDHPGYQLALGFATLAGFLLAAAILLFSPGVRDWIATAYRDYGVLLLSATVVLVVVLLIRNRRLQQRAAAAENVYAGGAGEDSGGDLAAIEAISEAVPGGDALQDYLVSTLFASGRLEHLRGWDGDHYVSSYEKSFKVQGSDIETFERYSIQNCSETPTTSLALATFGGSSLREEELTASAVQRSDSAGEQSLRLAIDSDGDRFKLFKAHFASAIPPGESTVIEYREEWPRAMMYGVDAVFYTQVLYFARGISQLTSKLEFDIAPTAINPWWYDIDTGLCEPDGHPIAVLDGVGSPGASYEWTIGNPQSSRIYFIVFDRPVPRS